jgi:Plasmid pRiA4b ORF-3-like protein
VQLRSIDPVVWRRLLVPGAVRLGKLDLMIQAAMGWTNSHLHCFRIGELSYGPKYIDDFDDDVIDMDEKTLRVSEAFEVERRLVYEYDFGDSWEHDVVVEDRIESGLVIAGAQQNELIRPPDHAAALFLFLSTNLPSLNRAPARTGKR